MARTPNVKIVSWGEPPAPEPTGWDAVRVELDKKPGEWANVGEMTNATARKVQTDRLPASEGYEFRIVPGKDDRRVAVWVRRTSAEGTPVEDAPKVPRARRGQTESVPAE